MGDYAAPEMSDVNGFSGNMVNGTGKADTGPAILTDCLIVGTGPAGGSLACFLAQHGESTNQPLVF